MSSEDKTKLNGIATGANKYTHPTSSGNKHIPSGGSSGQILRWGADGTAVWGADNNTTYSPMSGATASKAGTSGLVPAPAAGKQGQFLRGDGTWATPSEASKLVTGRTIQTNLGSTSAATFDGTANITPGVTGTLSIANGGTGAATAEEALTALGAAAADHSHEDATISTSGMMSASDKEKLDGYPDDLSDYSTTDEMNNAIEMAVYGAIHSFY